MMILRVILMMCIASTFGFVDAAGLAKKAHRRPLLFQNDAEIARCCKQLCIPISNACYFAEKDAEQCLCSYCCGSSQCVEKNGVKQQVIRHYSCCGAYKAMELVNRDTDIFLKKNPTAQVDADEFLRQVPVLCCIQCVQSTFTYRKDSTTAV